MALCCGLSVLVRLELNLHFDFTVCICVSALLSFVILHACFFFSSPKKQKLNRFLWVLLTLSLCVFFGCFPVSFCPFVILFWVCTCILQFTISCYFKKYSRKIKSFYLFWLLIGVLFVLCIPLFKLPPKIAWIMIIVAASAFFFSFFQAIDAMYTCRDPKKMYKNCSFYLSMVLQIDSCYMVFVRIIIHMLF